ncbi:DHHC palmitoyltransferase-domain-containing protein [Cristinia sonorae]|uniref:Palmitoyltransferase n=1 Tax=Cristinia sonorae TaxID=1940300 RepID=A0A8K0UX81_9AGAR|nr:DHHC palmitoyltransferase-domain-containing protein [Cristinia sonorae]
MSAPHSFSTSHSQRVAAQLPFSPSQSGSHIRQPTSNPTSPAKTVLPLGPLSSIPLHVRSGSVASNKSRPGPASNGSPVTESPHVSIPMYQPRPLSSGSAISSSSFYYHMRPNNSTPPPPVPPLPSIPQTPPPRPLSAGSMISSEAHIMTPVHLTSFAKHSARESDVSDSLHASTEDLHYHLHGPPAAKVTTQKHSREPLLPIGSKPSRVPHAASRPSLTISSGPYGRSESSISPGGRMRDSFEKLFKRNSYRRGSSAGPSHKHSLTGSSSRHPYVSRSRQDSPISPGTNGRMTFEVSDDETPLSAASRYKENASHGAASSASFMPMEFNPIPPDTHPPLSETPILDPKTNLPIRRYRVYPSRNRFFFDGRLLTGGDSPLAFIGSLLVLFGISGGWFGTTCVWWWKHESPAVAAVGAYMCLLTISSMCATAFRDPGILPRNLDPEPPYAPASGSSDSIRTPFPRDLKVRAGIVRVKYCPTCRTYRPPRSSHCKMCDNCVDNCDHHCQWVNNCVGRRNYTAFFTFLTSAVTTLILVICTTAIHLYLLTRAPFGLSFKQALRTSQGTGSAVVFCVAFVVIWPVGALLAYHLRLLLLNVTTIEQIRNQAHKTLGGPPPPNPFSHGNWRRNLFYVMCRPGGFSWLDATGLATEDKREINPGMLVMEDDWRGPVEDARGHGQGKGQ